MKHKTDFTAFIGIAICCLMTGCGSGQRDVAAAMDSPQNIAQEFTAREPATPWDGAPAGIHTAQEPASEEPALAGGGMEHDSEVLVDFSPKDMLHEYSEAEYAVNKDGTYTYDGIVYRYKLLYKSKSPTEIREFVTVLLSNSKDLTDDEVSNAGYVNRGEEERLKCVLVGSGCSKLSPENTEEDTSGVSEDLLPEPNWRTYTTNADGTYTCEGIVYRYRLLLTGVYRNAAAGSRKLVLTNNKDLTYDAIAAAMFSSRAEETLLLSECVTVGVESIPAENYTSIPLPENGTVIK